MYSDWKEISTEKHELNYLLNKYGKRETESNREKLIEIIKSFKKDALYKPHQHKDFYKYVEDNDVLGDLEDF